MPPPLVRHDTPNLPHYSLPPPPSSFQQPSPEVQALATFQNSGARPSPPHEYQQTSRLHTLEPFVSELTRLWPPPTYLMQPRRLPPQFSPPVQYEHSPAAPQQYPALPQHVPMKRKASSQPEEVPQGPVITPPDSHAPRLYSLRTRPVSVTHVTQAKSQVTDLTPSAESTVQTVESRPPTKPTHAPIPVRPKGKNQFSPESELSQTTKAIKSRQARKAAAAKAGKPVPPTLPTSELADVREKPDRPVSWRKDHGYSTRLSGATDHVSDRAAESVHSAPEVATHTGLVSSTLVNQSFPCTQPDPSEPAAMEAKEDPSSSLRKDHGYSTRLLQTVDNATNRPAESGRSAPEVATRPLSIVGQSGTAPEEALYTTGMPRSQVANRKDYGYATRLSEAADHVHDRPAESEQSTPDIATQPLSSVEESETAPEETLDTTGMSRSQVANLGRLMSAKSSSDTVKSAPSEPDATPIPGLGRSSMKAYYDIAKYSKPGEDLDWTKATTAKERLRLQSLIASRKYIEKRKRRTAEASKSDPRDESSPASTPKRIRLLHSTPRPEASEEPLEVQKSVPSLTEEEALALNDEDFMAAMKTHLTEAGKSSKSVTFATKQARRMKELIDLASPPRPDEALFLSGEEAAKQVQANVYFHGPIFVANQQRLPLQTVSQFLSECYDDEAEVYVQDPNLRVAKNQPQVSLRTIGAVKKKFAEPVDGKPWNLLELATHYEDGLRPDFLNTEDCRLLTKLKFPTNADKASRKGYDPGWKEVEKWALVAQAGALTEPHQDSHGYSTYITVNQGLFGYGWLSNPTPAERAAWSQAHDRFIGGRWRYVLLRPGQTVYFPAGTVHFVFRLPATGNTLAFGGHVLRCSQIVRWVRCLIDELRNPCITNEDLTVSAPGYLARVGKFLRGLGRRGEDEGAWELWGGREAVEEFWGLKREFEGLRGG